MKFSTNMQNVENQKNNLDNEINLIFLWQTILREKFNLATIVIISTIISIIYSLTVTPVWKGAFKIVISNNNNNSSLRQTNDLSSLVPNLKLNQPSKETEKIILMSPSVLNPVFEFVKNYYEKKGNNYENIYFEKWRKDNLKIDFEKKSNVLNVSYYGTDKELILKTLTMISEEYKDFSGRSKRESLKRSISYLKSLKKIWEKKSLTSQKELNEFSINNGLGNIDGFVGIGKPKNPLLNLNNSLNIVGKGILTNNTNSLVDGSSISAGQRFESQFALLSEYETMYTDLSSKLKPSSKYLQSLKTKIDTLRDSLKRPNEILIKYKTLVKGAQRNERIFDDISSQLIATELESVKTQNPWEMISIPTIDRNKVFPNKKSIVLLTFFISIILGSLILIIKEKLTGKVFNLETVESRLNINFLNTLYKSQTEISEKIIHNLIQKMIEKDKDSNIAFIKVGSISENKIPKVLNRKISLLDLTDLENINKSKISLIFIEKKITTFKEIELLKKFLEVYESQIYGWVFIE